jgi:hypothetical protein
MGSTSADIGRAICKVFEQTHVDSRKEYLPGFSKMDNVFVFTRWDWSELETIFEPLESFPPSKIGHLQYVYSSRIFLREFKSQVSEWNG